jgi:hypothetical protein
LANPPNVSRMDIIYYCRLVLRTAFRHSASVAQAILFFILVIIGAAIWLLPVFGMTVNLSALLSIFAVPQFYAILFWSIVIVRLICAPYWIWKDERKARIVAEEAAKPQMNTSLITNSEADIRGKLYAKEFLIFVENTGYHNLSNCQVTMADRNMTEPKHLCTPFALRPFEKNRIPIIKFKYSPKSQSAEAYPWVNLATPGGCSNLLIIQYKYWRTILSLILYV